MTEPSVNEHGFKWTSKCLVGKIKNDVLIRKVVVVDKCNRLPLIVSKCKTTEIYSKGRVRLKMAYNGKALHGNITNECIQYASWPR